MIALTDYADDNFGIFFWFFESTEDFKDSSMFKGALGFLSHIYLSSIDEVWF